MKLKYYIMLIPILLVLVRGQGLSRAMGGESGLETCTGHGDRDALARLLSDHESMPPAGLFEPHDPAYLKDIALSSCYLSFTRGRAMRMLGLLQGAASVPFLEAVMKDSSKSFYLRIEAAHVLKSIRGSSGPDDLARSLAPLLESGDARLRAAALAILADLDTPLARSMMEDHGLIERNRDILSNFYTK